MRILMRRLMWAMAFAGLSLPALAAGWQSGEVEDEGGPTMQAWVETGSGEVPDDLRLMCAGEEGISVRFAFGSGLPEGTELPADKPLPFDIYVDDAYIVVPMQLEEMDGAYAAYMPADAPLIRLLKSGKTVKFADATKLYHDVTFPLEGSGKAIAALIKSCN